MVLGPDGVEVSSVQTTFAGATRQEDAARQVQLDQPVLDLHAPGLHNLHDHPKLGGLPGHDVLDSLLQFRPGGTRHKHHSVSWSEPGVWSHIVLHPRSPLPLTGPVERDLATVGLLTLTLVTSEPVGDEVKSVGLAPPRQHELVRIFR